MKLTHKFIVFCIVGFLAFLIDYTVFNIFYHLGFDFIVALTIAVIIAMTFNFTVNRNFTFNARGTSVTKQVMKWLSVYFIAFLARIVVGKVTLGILGETPLTVQVAYFAGIAVIIPIDFLGSYLWAFRKK